MTGLAQDNSRQPDENEQQPNTEGLPTPDPANDPDNTILDLAKFADDQIDHLKLPDIPEGSPEERAIKIAMKRSVEQTAEKLIGEDSGISWHVKPPLEIYREDLFEKFKKPFVLPGTQDVTSFLFLGGLTASGYPWMDFATKIYERSGYHTEVYPLAGHDGTWAGLRDTTEQDWIAEIKEKVENFPEPPIVFCYSTSLLAVCEIERQNPGTFKAIIGVGGPFELGNEKLETYLDRGKKVDSFFRAITFGQFSPITYGSVPMDMSETLNSGSKVMRRSPSYRRLPLPTALSLRRLQLLARSAPEEITIPFFYGQGEDDNVVGKNVPKFLEESLASEHKTFKMYKDSAHGPMLGPRRYEMLRDVCNFLRDTLERETGRSDIPDFKTRLAGRPTAEMIRRHLNARAEREDPGGSPSEQQTEK